MNKSLIICFLCHILMGASTVDKAYLKEIKKYHKELNKSYQNAEDSPLLKKDRLQFKAHPFFEIDSKYRVVADFVKEENPEAFEMPTSTDRLPKYAVYGLASFEIEGKQLNLEVYFNPKYEPGDEYYEHLFLPFTDLTSGEETYGGGRYVDIDRSAVVGDKITIDFNKSYHPYCAYNDGYSCPIPPPQNFLDVRIEAGVQLSEYFAHL